MIETIKKYISKDPISYIHITELLNRNHTILYASDNGFIIHDDKVDFIYISFSDINEMKKVLSNYNFEHYLAYEKEIVDFYGDTDNTTNLSEWVYNKKDRFEVSAFDIRKLNLSHLDFINSIYKALGPGEDNKEALMNGEVLGIFENNKLVGFIGRHPEGCIGMLKVLEEYRRKGYGEALEKAKINDLLDRNELAFDEVVEGNSASCALQSKLGLAKGDKTIYWKL